MASRREEQSSKAARLDRDNPPTRERTGNKARIARRSRATPAPELPKEMPTGGVAGGNLKGEWERCSFPGVLCHDGAQEGCVAPVDCERAIEEFGAVS
jgi:hypothetical protein